LHLLTHGFFKAGLFLGAGSVMHGMNDEVEMRKYGDLAKRMKITFATFAVGYLAIIGFPGFSGFFSKDRIIEAAFADNWVYGTAALLGAGITAFYMTRLMLMTFFGEARWDKGVHPHESPTVMTAPMVVLAFGSVFAGFLLVNVFPLESWLEPVFGERPEAEHVVEPIVVTLLVTVLVAIGVAAAWLFVGRRQVARTAPVSVSAVVRAARANLYGDAVNESVLMRPGQWLTRALVFVDNKGVDGAVNGVAALIGGSSARLGRAQNGFVRSYALGMLGGSILVVAALLAVRFG
ncbi:MAG: proton-conducting transporter membrane subunit, partial [Geodermatophilaceae bacterium]